MRLRFLLRLLVFAPPAALISAAILVSASTLVSALEATLTPDVPTAIVIERFESRCQALDRKIEVLSRAATSCDQDLQCLGSPILCPIAMDSEMERDYRALREERREYCGVPHQWPELSNVSLRDFSVESTPMDSSTCRAVANPPDPDQDLRGEGLKVFAF